MTALTAPGNARVSVCPSCDGDGRDGTGRCLDCRGSGYVVWKACPRCASSDWRYVNGRTEADGMSCGSCGASWAADHPGWVVQVVPAELAQTA